MFEGLDKSQLAGAVEALLFVSSEPVGVVTIAEMLEVSAQEAQEALDELRAQLEGDGRGIELREVAGGWRLYTKEAFHDVVEHYIVSWDTRKLSQAAFETLAIVAYCQPVTRASISSVRGVNSDSSVNSLLEKGLLREAGVADTPGNPVLYATTRNFLEKFGLKSVKDLPDLGGFAPDDEARAFIRNRLSDTRGAEAVEAYDEFREGDASVDAALVEAMAGALGTVEKIDFDELDFDWDEE